MESTGAIAGHPLHPMLVAFPTALLITVFIADLFCLRTQEDFWARFSYVTMAMGTAWTLLAAMPGLIDYLTLPMVNIGKWRLVLGLVMAPVVLNS